MPDMFLTTEIDQWVFLDGEMANLELLLLLCLSMSGL
jgi:hypothetical protein